MRGADGAVRDVEISYPCDLARQMLEYSAATKATRDEFEPDSSAGSGSL